jgi:hypothetical protein
MICTQQERCNGNSKTNRARFKTSGDDIGKSEAPDATHGFRDQHYQDRPTDETAHRVYQAVESAQRDQANDAKQSRRPHEVAGERQTILPGGHGASRDKEILLCTRASHRPKRNRQRQDHEQSKDHNSGRV